MTEIAPTLPPLDPVTQHVLDSFGAGVPIYARSSSAYRACLAQMQSAPMGRPGAIIKDMTFPVGPTGSVAVRIVRPRRSHGVLPIIVYLHGGGWVAGDSTTHDRLIREIAVGADAAVVFVEYSLAPEAQFPVALEQAYGVLQHIVNCASELALDGSRLAVVGDDVGGTLAAAVALMAKQRRGPLISLQVLLYPVTAAGFDTISYHSFTEGPWLTRATMQWFWDSYIPDTDERQSVLATPLSASVETLRDLPETLLIVAESDVLRDEGESYARKLANAGVRVTSVRYCGAIHDFVLLNPLADTPAARSALAQVICTLKGSFG